MFLKKQTTNQKKIVNLRSKEHLYTYVISLTLIIWFNKTGQLLALEHNLNLLCFQIKLYSGLYDLS